MSVLGSFSGKRMRGLLIQNRSSFLALTEIPLCNQYQAQENAREAKTRLGVATDWLLEARLLILTVFSSFQVYKTAPWWLLSVDKKGFVYERLVVDEFHLYPFSLMKKVQ